MGKEWSIGAKWVKESEGGVVILAGMGAGETETSVGRLRQRLWLPR